MSSSLKNVSVEDLENAIAEALQKFAPKDWSFSVSINELKFAQTSSRVDVSMHAWESSDKPFEGGDLVF